MIEFDLRIPVARWLLSRGLSPICEVASLNNCDFVGVRFAERPVRLTEMVAVELKLKDVAGVFEQCYGHTLCDGISEVWAALPILRARRHRARFAEAGIGVLAVMGPTVEVVVPAARKTPEPQSLLPWKNLSRRRYEYRWRMAHPQMLREPAKSITTMDQAFATASSGGMCTSLHQHYIHMFVENEKRVAACEVANG